MKFSTKSLLATAIACALSAEAAAQRQIQEQVITATRREESLQDVSISVTAVTGEAIVQGGFSDVEDLSVFIPNLYMNDAFSGQQLYIRGIGTSEGNEAFEQAVAQFHDGVYYGRDNLGQNGLYDLQRLEVVRGPQPTFAGQSATAGALNMISRRPGDELEGNIQFSYGNDEEANIEFGIGGPVTDTLGLRFSGRYYELGDPGYTQFSNGEPLGYKENSSFRLVGEWNPTDRFSLTFKYERQDVLQTGTPGRTSRCDLNPATSIANPGLAPGFGATCALEHLANGIPLTVETGVTGEGGLLDAWDAVEAIDAANGLNPGDPGAWTPVSSRVRRGMNLVKEFRDPSDREHVADIAMINFDYDIGGFTLSSTTSSVSYDKFDVLDPDNSSFAIFRAGRIEFFEQLAQEIRLSSSVDQTFSWMVGGYWQQHDLDSSIPIYLPTGVGFQGSLVEDSSWSSVFFSGTYNISDTFRLNVGARYQDVEKEGVFTARIARLNATSTAFTAFGPFPGGPAAKPVPLTSESSDTLPEVGFEWDAYDDVMLYAKYAEAFKAGGFVMSPAPGGNLPNQFTYRPERAEGLELGLKSILAGGQLRLNLAFYDVDYTDLQVTIFDDATSTFETTNAAAANTSGVEFDGQWLVTDNFTLGFSGQVGKAKYEDYRGADACNSLGSKQFAKDTGLSAGQCTVDLSGTELPRTPEWTAVLSPQYDFNVGSGLRATFTSSILFSDGYYQDAEFDPLAKVDSFERVDMRLSIQPIDGNWLVAFYGRDVTDEGLVVAAGGRDFQSRTTALAYDAGGAAPSRGARYGIQVSYSF